MVPLYAVSSLIALFSLEAAFVIDVIRDIYEVRACFLSTHFVIQCGWRVRLSSYTVSSAFCFRISAVNDHFLSYYTDDPHNYLFSLSVCSKPKSIQATHTLFSF